MERVALEERTRERVPLDWAMTQNNLGNALERLGEREAGTARLEEAVAAFRLALEERTRERVPLDWATMQVNLGNALRMLGGRADAEHMLSGASAALLLARQVFVDEAGQNHRAGWFDEQLRSLDRELRNIQKKQ
jgi:tetratricopeptide (TPR) repeat protein